MPSRLTRLRLAVACALTASLPALAIQPFVVKDIRVEGVQRQLVPRSDSRDFTGLHAPW